MSFLREKYVAFGGPDGGNGGNGGHVIFQADRKTKDLAKLNNANRAENGQHGQQRCCHGKNAPHLCIRVPIGTMIKVPYVDKIVSELIHHDQIFIAARGGLGGHGNNFYLANDCRTPVKAEVGGFGEEYVYDVEMRVIAVAGLIGYPNAGKSTLLRAISRAKPKVAAYPFTTLKPHVGIVHYDDFEQLAVADIPGLIEGAHRNEGLGVAFLKHVERCSCLWFVLDYSLGDLKGQLKSLRTELNGYKQGLGDRPSAVIVNKIDLAENRENLSDCFQKQLADSIDQQSIFPISAKYGIGIMPLLAHLRLLYDKDMMKDEADSNKLM